MRILVVDDDRDLVELLTFAMQRAGLKVLPAYGSDVALKLLEDEKPDLAVIDINLGAWNGFDLLTELRKRSSIPVIILTARGAEDDKLLGFRLGADDYVTKPFSYQELIARIQANLKRHGQEWSAPQSPGAILRIGPISMNAIEHTVTKGEQPVVLTGTEFRLLHYLMINAGSIVPATAILKHVWGYEDPWRIEVLWVHIYRLRRKLEDDPKKPRLLQTVKGVGITLRAEAT